MRIVVVEDERKSRRGIIQLISKINLDYLVVVEADNGLSGMALILQEKPDLVIADIKMPKMNGLDMLHQLKENGLKFKAIILSGFSDFDYAQKAIKLGIYEYLLKPITVEDLEQTLRNIEKVIEVERLLHVQGLTTIKNALQKIALGNMDEINSISKDLKTIYGVDTNDSFTAVTAYLGSNMDVYKEAVLVR